MKILIKQFLSQNHSWAVVGRGLAKAFKAAGHKVHLFSTDGIKHLPNDLKENLIGYTEENQTKIFGRSPDFDYDMQISYTAPKNFSQHLRYGSKNRFGIWTYEWNGKNVLPSGFAKQYQNCDLILAPSNFSKDIFVNSGVPEKNIKVISHGFDKNQYLGLSTIKLPTNKKFKILANIAQNHSRKNIPGMLEAYGKAFTNKDDVCLILKGKSKKNILPFEIDLNQIISEFKKRFPNHAELKIYSEFLEDVSELYRSVDAVFTASHAEGFLCPALEALASGKLNIAPNYGGQLDFLNNDNSYLIDGKIVLAPPSSMYWEAKNNAMWFEPSIDHAADLLRKASQNYEQINNELKTNQSQVIEKYNWNQIASQIIELMQ